MVLKVNTLLLLRDDIRYINSQDINFILNNVISYKLIFNDLKLEFDDDVALYITPYHDQWWYKNGLEHRDKEPAVILADGHKEWWKYGRKIK